MVKERLLMKPMVGILAAAALAAPAAVAQPVKVDPSIPSYQKTSGVSGNINSVGSDTMNNMMTLWAESFTKLYPNVKVQVEGKGSSTAPPALIAGTAQFGPMSRAMRSTEIDQFEGKYGYKPTQIRTSYDALAVYVNKDNPIEKLTLAQVDAAFSKSRRRGGKNVATWGDLGLTGDWAARPISLYGRNSASGTYGFFKEHTLKNGDYKDTVKEQPGSASVVQGVTEDRYGMGYSGIGYRTSGVKPVPLAETTAYSDGNYADVVSGKYPLSRFLYIYINKAPGKSLDPLVREFVKFIASREGQEVVVKDGYLPLSAEIAKQERAKVE
jgi:phosphate transport system substrate-binding protein